MLPPLQALTSHSFQRDRVASRSFCRVSQVIFCGLALLCGLAGCGTTRSYTATEQLLMSDAVDATVSKIDFSPLAGKKVFLDTTYMKMLKAPNIILDSDYVASSIRQQMLAASVFLVDNRDEAELIAEARLGTMGLDGHNVTYGVPASNMLSGASVLAGTSVPAIPELSLGRREAKLGAAKVAVFAYKRTTREPYWQSGIAKSSSTARDTWFLGIGPWQAGTIYDGTRFAGGRTSRVWGLPSNKITPRGPGYDDFRNSRLFAAALQEQAKGEGNVTQVAQAAATPPAAPANTNTSNNPAPVPTSNTTPAPTTPAPTTPAPTTPAPTTPAQPVAPATTPSTTILR